MKLGNVHNKTLAEISSHTAFLFVQIDTASNVNLDHKGKQGNEPESPLFYFHREKAAQAGFKPTTCMCMYILNSLDLPQAAELSW